MKKVLIVCGVLFCGFVFFPANSFSADKRTDRLYELYNSTSTPRVYRQILQQRIARRERVTALRTRAALSAQKRDLAGLTSVKTSGVSSSSPLTLDPAFKLGEVYCYPNPAKKTNPTFHIETGLADKVELKVYDTAGDLVHEISLNTTPQVIDDGQGPQYAYEYLWDVRNRGSGVYIFIVATKKGNNILRKSGRCAVIK